MFVILAMGLGGALFAFPMLALANTSDQESSSQAEEVKRFRAFLDEDWKRAMVDQPETATWLGFPGQNRRWSDKFAARHRAPKETSSREYLNLEDGSQGGASRCGET
jgi:hypothetical protein